jgi:hypothetical protein
MRTSGLLEPFASRPSSGGGRRMEMPNTSTDEMNFPSTFQMNFIDDEATARLTYEDNDDEDDEDNDTDDDDDADDA